MNTSQITLVGSYSTNIEGPLQLFPCVKMKAFKKLCHLKINSQALWVKFKGEIQRTKCKTINAIKQFKQSIESYKKNEIPEKGLIGTLNKNSHGNKN